jgi:hypothetical protein
MKNGNKEDFIKGETDYYREVIKSTFRKLIKAENTYRTEDLSYDNNEMASWREELIVKVLKDAYLKVDLLFEKKDTE